MTDIQGFARLGDNPKLKFIPTAGSNDPKAVAEVRLCLSNYKKRGEDDFEDRGFWVDASIWGEQAEIVARNFRQGDKVFVIGDLYAVHWPDKESGENRSRPKFQVELIFTDLRSLASFRFKPRGQRDSELAPTTSPSDVSQQPPHNIQATDIPFEGFQHIAPSGEEPAT